MGLAKSSLLAVGLVLAGIGLAFGIQQFYPTDSQMLTPQANPDYQLQPSSRELEELSFPHLRQRLYPAGQIEIKQTTANHPSYLRKLFTYQSDGYTVSGQMHLPKSASIENKRPVIILLRGYAPAQQYYSGFGTQRVAAALAQAGFITLAPDFLGYGQSDMPRNDIWWERFNKPVQVMNLIASLNSLPMADSQRLGLWGHSNGGQIALSVLEISGQAYPTSLWNPVSKPFPYSILYYTDDPPDYGKELRRRLALFEWTYEVEPYSITNYFDWITAPINLHQGGQDKLVPYWWSEQLKQQLDDLGITVNYYFYPQADHNLVGAWNQAVERDIKFFSQLLNSESSTQP